MGTSLIASLAIHRSISHYVASLLAQKSHSSRREQNASLMAQSSSFFLLAQETTAFAHLLSGLGPRAFGPAVELGIPIPFRSTLIDVCLHKHQCNGFTRCQDSRPPARYHTIVICKENNIKPPATRSTSQKYHENTTYWKMSRYPHVLYYLC